MAALLPTLTIYEALDGWRWRLRARNGENVADSAEAYFDERGAVRAARMVRRAMRVATLVTPHPLDPAAPDEVEL